MLKAVVFDLDGTLTRPFLDFTRIRLEIGVEMGRLSLLEQIREMSDEERERALEILERHEREASEKAELNDGVHELFEAARLHGLLTAIVTRNSGRSTEHVLEKLGVSADRVITRDSGLPLKPDPAPLAALAGEWGIEPGQMLMVGDFRYDVQCGKAAGALTCLVTNGRESGDDGGPDYLVESPGEVAPILESLVRREGEGGE